MFNKCIFLSLLAFTLGADDSPPLDGAYHTNTVTPELARSASELVRGALAIYQASGSNAARTNRQLVKLLSHKTKPVAGTNTEIRGYFKDECGGQVREDTWYNAG